MNEVELANRLRQALAASGRTAWEQSRRANVKLALLEDLLAGSSSAPVGALCRVAHSLELTVHLTSFVGGERVSSPIPTVVDNALTQLDERDGSARATAVASSSNAADAATFLARERELLDRLEVFIQTPEWLELLSHLSAAHRQLTSAVEHSPGWLAAWMIQPTFELGGLPLDVAGRPGGLHVVTSALKEMLGGDHG